MSSSIKNGGKIWILHKRRHTEGQYVCEKMHIINHYRNASENHNDYHYTLTRMAEIKETDGWECETTIFSHIAGESVKWYCHFEKQFVVSL